MLFPDKDLLRGDVKKMLNYSLIFLISLIFSFLITPVIRNIAFKIGAIDSPDYGRRIHNRQIPNIGGIAIYLSFVITVILFSSFDKTVIGVLTGGTIIIILGFLDDLFELNPGIKLLGQILAAAVLILFGININFITNPISGGLIYPGFWSIPLTIFWVVAITNTINLIDGLDGLAAGVSVIAVFTLFLVALQEGQALPAILAIALAGSSLGFLRHNFYPAKIFMGDTGAMFSGFILAAISIMGALKSAAVVTVFVPLLALGIPIFDTLFAIIRRLYNNEPISKADKGHIHHRLLAMGWTQSQAVLIVYGISGLLGLIAIIINGFELNYPLILPAVVIFSGLLGAWKIGILDFDLTADSYKLNNTKI